MNVIVRNPLEFSRGYAEIANFIFSAGGRMPGMTPSAMLRSHALKKWMCSQHEDFLSLTPRHSFGGVQFETNCLGIFSAISEMSFVADQNFRCEKAAFCFTLSWGDQDCVTDESAFSAVRHCLSTLDMTDFPYIAVIRRIQSRTWCRVLASRVPVSGGPAADMWNNTDRLQYACRELELIHGWVPEMGSWVTEEGRIIRPQDRDF